MQVLTSKSGECRYWGLSTETKPNPASSNGFGYYETDTGRGYLCDGVSWNETTALGLKQDLLVSGTNIKTINGSSILGSGDLVGPYNFLVAQGGYI